MRFLLWVCILFSLGWGNLTAQNSLALENMKKFKRIIFSEGETLIFKAEGSKRWFRGQIGEVYDSSFVIVKSVSYMDGDVERRSVFKDEVTMSSIEMIKFPDGLNGNASGIGPIAFWGGLALMGVFGINKLVVGNADESEFDGTSFIIAGGLSATGLALMLIRNRKVRIKGNWRLRSMPPMTPLINTEGPK